MNIQLPRGIFNWTGAFLLLGFVASGCQSFRSQSREPVPPDYLKVTALGLAHPENVQPFADYKKYLAGPLMAKGTAVFAQQIADPAQRRLRARAEARRSALRDLGRKLAALTDTQGHKLGERLKAIPDKQAALGQLLETASRVEFKEQSVSSTAQVTMDGLLILRLLNKATPGSAFSEAKLTLQQIEARRIRVRDAALTKARAKIGEQILNIPLADGRLFKDALAADASAKKEFDAIIKIFQIAPPDEVRYLPDGSCQVTLFFNKNIARELAAHKAEEHKDAEHKDEEHNDEEPMFEWVTE